ncbi:MAG: hypothetical protein HF308_14405 [Ignavibacteria bacterium]|jgi:hypothetical protein|nr:hypothetical protein [Ignavibacteria bacterium]
MPKVIDLSGMRFGKLMVIERDWTIKAQFAMWKCVCDCGNETTVASVKLTGGRTKSCGCLVGTTYFKHKEAGTRLYKIWVGIKDRCGNRKTPIYVHYGDRGIKICDEWEYNYESFRDWALNNGYDDSLSIDRIDVDGDYEPNNCRWVTQKQQMGNTRANVWFTAISPSGETYVSRNQREFAEEHGLYYQNVNHCLTGRIKSTGGWKFVYNH